MDQSLKIDYRQLGRLQNQNYQLKQELEYITSKYENLKKQQQILEEIHRHYATSQQPANQDSDELSMMKEQFVAIVKQKQQLEQSNRELRQKIEDMKYTIQQMRQLSDKQERIHLEFLQIQKFKYQHMMLQDVMVDSDMSLDKEHNKGLSMNKLKSLLKQAERQLGKTSQKVEQLEDELAQERQATAKNVQKLQKCSQIAKQMEQYYTNELQARQRTISQLELELEKYSYQQPSHQYYELPSPHTKLPSINTNEDCSSLKCSSIVSEYHHHHHTIGPVDTINFSDESQKDQLIHQFQDQYRHILDQINASHQKKLLTYHQQIKYLSLKVEALEAQKTYLLKNNANLSHLSHSDTFIINDHLQSIESLSQSNHNKSLKNVGHQQSVNLKLSKTSANDSFTQFTPKSQISQSVARECSQSKGGENGSSGIRPKLTAIKTPSKTLQKTLNLGGNRNSCSYQRLVLGQKNAGCS